MERADLKTFDLPNVPGVYLFKRGRSILYVGKATNLRDRVRSYFDDDLIATRGPRIVDMVTRADRLSFEPTPTVLEALVREAALIKKYLPPANVVGRDDSSFLYAVITDETLPRVLMARGKDVDFERKLFGEQKLREIYGPFPSGAQLREALRLIRRIFPFYDTQKPVHATGKHHAARLEFNRQIRQYPDSVDAVAYRRNIRRVALLLSGRCKQLRTQLARDMRKAAAAEQFEEAAVCRKALFALDHLQDVSLIKEDRGEDAEKRNVRIEAYDTAHLAGTNAIGVMTVLQDGAPDRKSYRTFRIRGVQKNDDISSLKEILSRRLGHPEWPFPHAIVIDGGKTQKRAAEQVLAEQGIAIPVAAVVKDERHRPREVLGAQRAGITEADAVQVNAEAHRFSLTKHRAARSKPLK